VKFYHCKACKRELFEIDGPIVTIGAIVFVLPVTFTFYCDYCQHKQTLKRRIVKLEPACYDTVVAPV
jgi:hypothetical protein